MDYRVVRWPYQRAGHAPQFYYNPQYYDEDAKRWRPYTVERKRGPQRAIMEARLYPTRLEAEQFIEVMKIKEKREAHAAFLRRGSSSKSKRGN